MQPTPIIWAVFGGIFLSAQPSKNQSPGPSLVALQAQIIQLQKDLADCKAASTDAATRVTKESERARTAPIVEAVDALRAVHSVADGGSIMDFKQYFLQAKVKVEALADSPEKTLLLPTLEAYSDANTLLLAGVKAGVGSFEPAQWSSLVARYPGISLGSVQVAWSNVTIVQNLREGGINLVREGYRRLQVVEQQLAKNQHVPTP